jgi:SOS-response transcriptional repressor LexA
LARYLQGEGPVKPKQTKPSKKVIQQVVKDELAAIGVVTGAELEALRSRAPAEILDEARRIQIAGAVRAERANLIGLHQFSSVPCGPWKDVLEEARPYFLPKDMAEVLGAQEGDWLLPCRGQSMREAGIPDGGLVVMHPLDGTPPESGAIILCCVEREGGQWLSTIKYFYRDAKGRPELRDGKLQPYHLPPDAKELHPLAILVGVMGKATETHTVKGRRSVQKKTIQDEGDRLLAQ